MRASRLTLISFVPVAALLAVGFAACAAPPLGSMAWTPASGDPAVINVTQASFAPGTRVPDAVLAECDLERRVPEFIARWAPVPVVLAAEPSGGARVLTLEITDVWAPPGGAFSGPKSLTLRGELQEWRGGNWARLGSFEGRRTTVRGGATCEMLYVVADALGKDVRAWMMDPGVNVPLGEL